MKLDFDILLKDDSFVDAMLALHPKGGFSGTNKEWAREVVKDIMLRAWRTGAGRVAAKEAKKSINKADIF